MITIRERLLTVLNDIENNQYDDFNLSLRKYEAITLYQRLENIDVEIQSKFERIIENNLSDFEYKFGKINKN